MAKKPIKLRNQLEEVEDHERAARLFRHILEPEEESGRAEADGNQSDPSSADDRG